jgi:hypothetical protein
MIVLNECIKQSRAAHHLVVPGKLPANSMPTVLSSSVVLFRWLSRCFIFGALQGAPACAAVPGLAAVACWEAG